MLNKIARRPLSRRHVLRGGLATATALGGSIPRRAAHAQAAVTLTLAVWVRRPNRMGLTQSSANIRRSTPA